MPRFALWLGCVVLLVAPVPLLSAAPNPQSPEKQSPEKQSREKLGSPTSITALPHVPTELSAALQDRRFADAIRLIDGALEKPAAAGADYLLYLRGRAQTELKLYEQALDTFRKLESDFPKSNWTSRARFGHAEIFIRQRNYQQAGEIYEREATRLLSAGRRDELAAIYLEFADRFMDGFPDESRPGQKTHDFKQAAEFYEQALALHPSLEKQQQIELRIAHCRQELNNLPAAIAGYRKFLADYGAEADTKNHAPVKLEIEARYRLGLALLATHESAEARKTWQDLLDNPALRLAESDLLTEAQFKLGQTYGVPHPTSDGDLELGVSALEAFLKAHPRHRLAPAAELNIALSYGARGRLDQAAATLKSLIGNSAYAASEELPKARNLLGEILFSLKKYDEAVVVWRAFLANHPNHSGWNGVLARITDAEYEKALEQYRQKNFNAAQELWEAFLKVHPLDERAPKILYLFGQMKYTQASDRVNERIAESARTGKTLEIVDSAARKLFEQAIEEWRRFVSKYPHAESPSRDAVFVRIGTVLEERLGRLDKAIEAYQQAGSDESRQRITRLTERQMDLLTPRKFRTKERAFVRLATRNVDKVTVKVYRVEMTDYFRKMHLAGAIETLDVGLIDPDKTFDFAVKGYEKLRPFENDVELPVAGPGVWAVTLSSEKLEATTMVVVSDIDVIVKCSRNELFVLAEDVPARKPAAGTRLLISDGSRIFAEETTNAEGILQKSYEELKTVQDLRVFAVREGHVASTVNALEGLDFAVGLSPVGQIYTDRPAYRAGELVNLKGIVRWVADDRFTFKEGEAFQLDVTDARGRAIHTAPIKLNRFGSFATSFVLPDAVPQGQCSIHLFQPAGKQSYTSSFNVHEAKLQQIRLEVDLPRKVYYRGEKITGKIRLRYYYGTPLAAREIQYRLADDRLQTGTTNAAGELAFEFPTRRFSESQTLEIAVFDPEHNLRTVEQVILAARGFDVRVSTVRSVYLGGETFDATVTVTDPGGAPVAVPLKFEILEKMTAARQSGERLIASHEISTDKETGNARKTIHIDKSGRFLLRATAVDRFGKPVSGAHDVLISGADDDVRLRILSDRHNYQSGDDAHVVLHWRQPPALALVTYEGASILGHRVVELQTGANKFDFPVDARLAPNFMLAVAAIDQTQLHQATSDFAVTRKLHISLKPSSLAPKPGDQLSVEITATDPQGHPVSAELSLAMVQRNLLDLFAAKSVTLDQFFGRAERKPSLRTMGSCAFLYRPITHGISAALLAEEQRRRELIDEEEAMRRLDPPIVSETGTRPRPSEESSDAPLDELVAEFKILYRAGRLDEAARLAKQAQQRNPDNPSVNSMLARVQIAKSSSKYGLQRFQEHLYEIEDLQRDDALAESDQKSPSDWGMIQNQGLNFRMDGAQVGMGGGMGGGIDDGFVGQRMPLADARKSAPEVSNGAAKSAVRPAPPASLRSRTIRNEARSNDVRKLLALSKINKESERELGKFGSPVFQAEQPSENAPTDAQKGINFFFAQSDPNRQYFWFAQDSKGQVYPSEAKGGENPDRANNPAVRLLAEAMLGETGYWNPTIVTGVDGKARITFRLPERSTAWKLRAAGIDGESLAGETDADLIAKKDFFGEMKLPSVFTAGDRADILVDVQNSGVERGAAIEVRLRLTIGDRATELKKSLVSGGPGVESVVFPAAFGEAGTAEFELTVSSGTRRDVVRAAIPVRPDGLPVFSTASGTAGQSTIAFVDVDHRLAPQNPRLEILIGPSVDRALLDAVLASSSSMTRCDAVLPTNSLERATSDVLGGVALLAMVRTSRTTETPEATALSVRIRAALAQLVAAQRTDGGWSWSGGEKASKSDQVLSSRVAWSFAAARRAGFAVPTEAFDQAIAYLSTALAAANPVQRDAQATLFQALAECGKGDFAIGNRLYRERNRLSNSALLHVALALARLDRKEMAGELLALVRIDTPDAVSSPPRPEKQLSPSSGGVELRALYLLALEEIQPTSDKVAKLADSLMAARQGSHWRPDKANGPAVAALARWFSQVKQVHEKYALTVYVNDQLLQKLTVDPSTDPSRRLEVPTKILVQGRPQKINFDMEGRGRFSYSASLTGFVPSDRLAATTNDWVVERWYEPAQRLLDGELIPRGFDVLSGSYSTFRNALTQLAVGTRGEVTLNVYRRYVRATPDEQLDYLVITEPIPAGASVLPDSVQGQFERYEISAGSITFYVGDAPYPGSLHYTLIGYVPGSFHAAPTVARSFYQPQRIAIAGRGTLEVLPRGGTSRDEYKLTPRELFEFGKRLVAKGKFAEGAEHLNRLLKQYRLQETPYREAVQALFKAALATGQNQSIVENFEIIKEKLPDIEVDFGSILRVALAYRALGEYERSFLVYRATIEATFQRETQIAGFLDDRGQFLRSVQVMERLLREYPAEAYVATATYALAQEVSGKAAAAAQNEELRKAGLTRVDLIGAAIDMLDHFVATWPNDPAADQAAFSAVSAFLDLEKYDVAIARSRRAISRYPDSGLTDSFMYVIGYSQYELGHSDEALETCRKVAEMTRKDPRTGQVIPADNKWQAVYISGQIFHSLGKPAEALAEYERVKDKFADAREAIDFFVHRRLSLPEIVTLRPNEPPKVTLTYRNIPRVDLKVYRVDLLKFGLLQRNLAKITAINLAGIRPYHELSLELGNGKDYRDREKIVSLPLKDEGAYLVVCRGDDDYASGLVLVSPLELAVQEDAASGRVRVTAKNAVSDRYVGKVLVKVIGSENPDFVSGETDLRGIFKADAIRGGTTVIARADGNRYAFFRGTKFLGAPAVQQQTDKDKESDQKQSQQAAPQAPNSRPLLENLERSNSGFQQQQRDSYHNLLRNRKKGVKAQDVF